MKLALSDDSGEEESKYEFSQKHNRNDNDSMFQDIEIARLKKELEKANRVSQLFLRSKFSNLYHDKFRKSKTNRKR